MAEHIPVSHQINVTSCVATRLVYPESGVAILEETKPLCLDIQGSNVLVRTLYSGISRGTEKLVFEGMVPDSEWQRMRCPHQTGEFSFSLSYGYACVGKVLDTGAKVSKVKPGDLVFVLHPHQDFLMVDEAWVNPLPDILPAHRAVLSANAETALNAVWDADLEENSPILIIGGGVVGLLTGFIAKKLMNTKPFILDVDPDKRSVAEALGLTFLSPDEIDGREFPTIFHTSGTSAGLQTAIECAQFEGLILEMSWYGTRITEVALGGAFHSRRLKIQSTQVGHVAPKYRKELTHSQRLQKAMRLLDDPALDTLLFPKIAFHDLPDQINRIFSSTSHTLCPLIEYKEPRKI